VWSGDEKPPRLTLQVSKLIYDLHPDSSCDEGSDLASSGYGSGMRLSFVTISSICALLLGRLLSPMPLFCRLCAGSIESNIRSAIKIWEYVASCRHVTCLAFLEYADGEGPGGSEAHGTQPGTSNDKEPGAVRGRASHGAAASSSSDVEIFKDDPAGSDTLARPAAAAGRTRRRWLAEDDDDDDVAEDTGLRRRLPSREQDSGDSFHSAAGGSEGEVDVQRRAHARSSGSRPNQDTARQGASSGAEILRHEEGALAGASETEGAAAQGLRVCDSCKGSGLLPRTERTASHAENGPAPHGQASPASAEAPVPTAKDLAAQSLKGVEAFLSRARTGGSSAGAGPRATHARSGAGRSGGDAGRGLPRGNTPGAVPRQMGILSFFSPRKSSQGDM
jgi:hypothetical protein